MPRYDFSHLLPIYGTNLFQTDQALQGVLAFFGLDEAHWPLLAQFGQLAGGEALEVADYVDRLARPLLHQSDIWGQRIDWVRIAPSHRSVLEQCLSLGIVYRTYLDEAPWHLHYAMGYLLSDPGMYCTLTVTNQTAYAIYKYASQQVRQQFLPPFLETEGNRAWFGATYYTETQGGSDLGANRALAWRDGERWRIRTQDKYFASNVGLADAALVTARPEKAPPGAKGLALFLVPALRGDGSPNYRIRRLKDKLATRAVPTGEVEMEEAEAYLLGEAEQGIYLALEVLSVARLANAVGALGNARKAQLAAYRYARKRSTFGQPLIRHSLVQKDFLEMELLLQPYLLLAFYAVDRFQHVWLQSPPYDEAFWYARFLNHLAKNLTAEVGVEVTRRAMELFGGIGFMEDFPIARLHREALVMPIWEGGSHIQALDMLESLVRKKAHRLWEADMRERLQGIPQKQLRNALDQQLDAGMQAVQGALDLPPDQAQHRARDLLNQLARISAAILYGQWSQTMANKFPDLPWPGMVEAFLNWQFSHTPVPAALSDQIADVYAALYFPD